MERFIEFTFRRTQNDNGHSRRPNTLYYGWNLFSSPIVPEPSLNVLLFWVLKSVMFWALASRKFWQSANVLEERTASIISAKRLYYVSLKSRHTAKLLHGTRTLKVLHIHVAVKTSNFSVFMNSFALIAPRAQVSVSQTTDNNYMRS